MLLAAAVAVFAAIHLVPAIPSLKAAAVARAGRAWNALFGLASTASLVLIVLAWRSAERVQVYAPPAWGRHANFTLMFAAFVLIGVFLFRGRWRQRLRFPLALAVLLWATGHLLANGDSAAITLFGGLFLYAAVHLALGLSHGVRPSSEVRDGHDALGLFAALALYGVMIQMHEYLIGVKLFSIDALSGLVN